MLSPLSGSAEHRNQLSFDLYSRYRNNGTVSRPTSRPRHWGPHTPPLRGCGGWLGGTSFNSSSSLVSWTYTESEMRFSDYGYNSSRRRKKRCRAQKMTRSVPATAAMQLQCLSLSFSEAGSDL